MVSVEGKYSNLTYDATNRLLSIYDVARGVTDQYRYGPEGMRYKKTESVVSGNAKTAYYLYEGNDILYEEWYEGSTRTSCKLNVFLGGENIGRVRKEGGTESVQYFYNDHLGSRRAVTDSAGAVQAKIDYSVWGVPTVTNYNGYDGSLDVSYTGKEADATKLYYFNARYYDRSMGRFITEDPARNGMNWFAYCNNNPLSLTDPTGLIVVEYSSHYKMNEGLWSTELLGYGTDRKNETVGKIGCTVDTLANMIKTVDPGSSVTPKAINDDKTNFDPGTTNVLASLVAEKYGVNYSEAKSDYLKVFSDLDANPSIKYSMAIDVAFGNDSHTVGAESIEEYKGKTYFAIEQSSINDIAHGYNRKAWESNDGMILVPAEIVRGMRYVWK